MGLSGIGPGSLLIVLLIVLVLFGSKKLGNIGQDLGGAIKGFKRAVGEGEAKSEESEEPVDGHIIEGSVSETPDGVAEKKAEV